MRKKKVCILQNGLARGGTDTFVVNLCKSFNKDLHEITVVNPCTKKEGLVRENEVLASGAKIVHTCDLSKGIKGKLSHLWKLYCLLSKERFDVFQTNIDLFNGPNLLVAWLAGVPIRCCHSHNSNQQKALVESLTLPIRIYQGVMRWLCWTFSNRRCGCSTEAMDFLYQGRPWKNAPYPTVIPNGINLSSFKRPLYVEGKKQQIGITAKYNIVTVGRLNHQKNALFIAHSFAELCKVRDDCHLVWVGTGDLEQQCRNILEEGGVLPRAHFLGSRDDVADILRCCDLFYFPSNFEGLGIAVIEAQAAGLPCLISDAVPREADCGLCHAIPIQSDVQTWIKALNEMLDGQHKLHIQEHQLRKYSSEHMARQMEKVFES